MVARGRVRRRAKIKDRMMLSHEKFQKPYRVLEQ